MIKSFFTAFVLLVLLFVLAAGPLLAQPLNGGATPYPTNTPGGPTATPTATRGPTLTPTPYPLPQPPPDWFAVASGGLNFGASVDGAGDVNGDGYDDVIVGQPADLPDDLHIGPSGAAYLFYGSALGLASKAAWVAGAGGTYENEFGASVSGAGDVNGDGYDDVVVGQPGYGADGFTNEGRVHVFYGSPNGLKSKADWTARSRMSLAYLGQVVDSAGDVNGDGYDDVFAGAYGTRGDKGWAQGRAYVWCGSPAGLGATPCWTAQGDQVKGDLGAGASGGLGDVNGDGYDDLLVSAPRYDSAQTDAGRVYLYLGSRDGLRATPAWVMDGNQSDGQLGSAGGAAGDVNGDGYADIILRAPHFEAGGADVGRVLVFHGSAQGPSQSPAWIVEGSWSGVGFGSGAKSAGDMDGDGDAEVAVGDYLYGDGQTNEGAVFIHKGSPVGLSRFRDFSAQSNIAYTYLGNAVAPAGDVNGDGAADLIVGAVQYNGNRTNCGAAFAWYGKALAPQATETPTATLTATLTPVVVTTPTVTPTSPARTPSLFLPVVILEAD